MARGRHRHPSPAQLHRRCGDRDPPDPVGTLPAPPHAAVQCPGIRSGDAPGPRSGNTPGNRHAAIGPGPVRRPGDRCAVGKTVRRGDSVVCGNSVGCG